MFFRPRSRFDSPGGSVRISTAEIPEEGGGYSIEIRIERRNPPPTKVMHWTMNLMITGGILLDADGKRMNAEAINHSHFSLVLEKRKDLR